MKLFSAVLFAGLVAIACAQGGGGMGALVKQCGESNGVDMGALKSAMTNPNPDSKVKCTFSCIAEKIGVMKADGSPNKAAADALLEKMGEKGNALKPVVDKCMGSMKAGLAKCESGWLATKCVFTIMAKAKQG